MNNTKNATAPRTSARDAATPAQEKRFAALDRELKNSGYRYTLRKLAGGFIQITEYLIGERTPAASVQVSPTGEYVGLVAA
jgi:hypothetical protein